MGIKFDVSNETQGLSFLDDITEKGYKKLIEFAENHKTLVRFTGIPIFLCECLLDLAEVVCRVVEPLIKGVANICGFPFFEKCKLSKGIKQIFLELPLNLLCIALTIPLGIVYKLMLIPIGMAIWPEWLLNNIKQEIDENKMQENEMQKNEMQENKKGENEKGENKPGLRVQCAIS